MACPSCKFNKFHVKLLLLHRKFQLKKQNLCDARVFKRYRMALKIRLERSVINVNKKYTLSFQAIKMYIQIIFTYLVYTIWFVFFVFLLYYCKFQVTKSKIRLNLRPRFFSFKKHGNCSKTGSNIINKGFFSDDIAICQFYQRISLCTLENNTPYECVEPFKLNVCYMVEILTFRSFRVCNKELLLPFDVRGGFGVNKEVSLVEVIAREVVGCSELEK